MRDFAYSLMAIGGVLLGVASVGQIASSVVADALSYINGSASNRNLCAELRGYVGSESGGIRLTSISSCSVHGNHFNVTGTIQ